MTEREILQNEDFPVDEHSTLLIEVKKVGMKVKVTVLDKYEETKFDENMVLEDADNCKIDPYCFSAMVFTSNALQMKPNVSFFAKKVKETLSGQEYISIILSRVDETHCG